MIREKQTNYNKNKKAVPINRGSLFS